MSPCPVNQYRLPNGTCTTACPSPWIVSGFLCNPPCPSTQFLFPNSTCGACPSPWVSNSALGYPRCQWPCSNGTYLFNGGGCFASCPAPNVTAGVTPYLRCIDSGMKLLTISSALTINGNNPDTNNLNYQKGFNAFFESNAASCSWTITSSGATSAQGSGKQISIGQDKLIPSNNQVTFTATCSDSTGVPSTVSFTQTLRFPPGSSGSFIATPTSGISDYTDFTGSVTNVTGNGPFIYSYGYFEKTSDIDQAGPQFGNPKVIIQLTNMTSGTFKLPSNIFPTTVNMTQVPIFVIITDANGIKTLRTAIVILSRGFQLVMDTQLRIQNNNPDTTNLNY